MPGIIDLQTNLRDLPYSTDGKQPYIRTQIPAYEDSGPTDYVGKDVIGRNGSISALLTDTNRITQWGLDGTGGLLFLLKQESLARSGVQTIAAGPARIYNPANTLAQIAVGAINGVHFQYQGVLPDTPSNLKYEYLQRNVNNGNGTGALNRLTALRSKLYNNLPGLAGSNVIGINSTDETVLIEYGGGPGSIGGVGNTKIRRYSYTDSWSDKNNAQVISGKQIIAYNYNDFTVSNIAEGVTEVVGNFNNALGTGLGILPNFTLFLNDNSPTTPQTKKRILGRITNYADYNRRKTYGDGDPGVENPNFDRQAYFTQPPTETPGTDLVNNEPLYKSNAAKTGQGYDDIIKFHFGVLDNNDPSQKTYVHLKAYLTNFSDSHQASWDSFKYMGRGENFYRYGGYDRSISVGFRAYVHSRIELFPVYNKLNYLASVMAPDYSTGGFMRGNIVYLTIGDYIVNTPGIMENIEYQIPQESTWELAKKDDGTADSFTGELPMLIDVSFGFKPIHSFLPRTVTNLNNPESKFISKLATG